MDACRVWCYSQPSASLLEGVLLFVCHMQCQHLYIASLEIRKTSFKPLLGAIEHDIRVCYAHESIESLQNAC